MKLIISELILNDIIHILKISILYEDEFKDLHYVNKNKVIKINIILILL